MRRAQSAAFLLVCVSLLSSCKINYLSGWGGLGGGGGGGGFTYNDVKGTDDSTVTPVARARLDISQFPDFKLAEGESAYLEASASTTDGGFSQDLGAGSSVIGGEVITGNLDVDFTMSEFTLVMGYRADLNEVSSGSIFAGGGYHDVSLDIDWSGGRAEQTKDGFGGIVGGLLDAEITDWMTAYVRGEFMLLPAKSHSIGFELGLEFDLWKNVGLLAGYRSRDYLHDHGLTGLDISARGLLLGMVVDF